MLSNSASIDQKFLAGPWLGCVVILLGFLAVTSTSLQMIRLGGVASENVMAIAAFVLGILASLIVWLLRQTIVDFLSWACQRLGSVPLWAIAVTGLALRLIWIALFPADPGSDGQIYLMLGERLQSGGSYEIAGTRAYWPIGYPLFLSGFLALFESKNAAYLVSNLALYVIGFTGTYRLGQSIAGTISGKFAATLFALWPNLVFSSATPEKEMLVLALLPWAAYFIHLSISQRIGHWQTLTAGAILGAAILVQPSLQFLPFVCGIFLISMIRPLRSGMSAGVLLCLGAALVVSPWTWRNYQLFDHFVLVSTNGGDNFYRANNPMATGGYTLRGEVELSSLGEIEQDKTGKRLAIEWIKQNPIAFARLAVEKQVRFMGDDAVGVYTTLKVGKASSDARIYGVLKVLANVWWLAAWGALCAFSLVAAKRLAAQPQLAMSPIWFWLYLFAIHSVFESAGKYHVPMLWVLCVMIGAMATSMRERTAS